MYHTLVIGAGQAGLAMSYFLSKNNKEFLVLDKGSCIGESWTDRYDSLVLFTPKLYSSLPGMMMEGEPHGLPSKDEVSLYLKKYAQKYQIPVQFNTEVQRVTQVNEKIFTVETSNGIFQTKNIIIATGPFHKMYIPSLSKLIDDSMTQLHSSEYRNIHQLQEGNVLVVGGGNSGAQIAVELSKTKETYLAISKNITYLPLELMGKSIFWWFDKLGILNATSHSFLGKSIQRKGDPIFGYELKRAVVKNEVMLRPKVISAKEKQVTFEDITTLEVQNIIWSTGFKPDYSWIQIENALNEKNEILHERGVSLIKGLYFLGLPWQSKRGSALLQGVGTDAEFLMSLIN